MKYVKCGGEVFELKLTPLGTNCRYCKEKEAVIKPAGIPLPLCKECFLTFCEKKVKMAIEKHKMFNPEDKVGVMVSGGKDSAALLAILKKTLSRTKNLCHSFEPWDKILFRFCRRCSKKAL